MCRVYGLYLESAEILPTTALRRLLLALLEAEGLRARDVKALWKSLVASQAGLRVVLDYATKNAADIVAK